MGAYTKQTWVNGAAGGTPINASRLTHMEDGISAANLSTGYTLVTGGSGVNAAIAINAAVLTESTIILSGVHYYSSPILIGTADRNIVCLPGAQLVKAVAFTDLYSIQVTAPRVKFYNFRQDGQRSAAANQTIGMVFLSGALNCEMHDSSVKSNRFHGVYVDPAATVDFYNTDISDNVHSTLAGYGLLAYGNVRTFGKCEFNDNGYAGCYTSPGTVSCHIDGTAKRNGIFGFQLSGSRGTSRYLHAEDNGSVDVGVINASLWNFGIVTSLDAGKTAAGDGAGMQFYGSDRCKVASLQATRGRSWGLCFSRRYDGFNTTTTADPGSGGATINVTSATTFPTTGAGTLDDEHITWTGKTSTSLTGVTRGQNRSTAVAHPIGRYIYGILPATALTADPGSGGATFNVASTANMTSAGFLWVDDEVVEYTGITATTITGVVRGSLNSTAAAHSIGAVVAPFLGSLHNVVETFTSDMFGSPDTDPALQISGGSQYNVVNNMTAKYSSVAVSIGEETWPKNNDYNEVGYLNAQDCPWGVISISGGNYNRFRKVAALDCYNYDPVNLQDALFFFDDQVPLGAAYGFGTVNDNRVDDYEVRTVRAPAPVARYSQKHTATGNIAQCHLTYTGTWNPVSIASGATTFENFTNVTGARVGDLVKVGFNQVYSGLFVTAQVYADDSVNVTLYNFTGGAVDLPSGIVRLDIHKFGA